MKKNDFSGNIIVTGATGTVGRYVVDTLLAVGQPLRALTRNHEKANLPAEVEVYLGDLTKPETLIDSFASMDQLVLFANPTTVETALKAAKRARVKHVVLVSSAAVTAGYDTTWNFVAEQKVQQSGIAWTIVCPGEFMMNTLSIWGPSIRRDLKVIEPFPDQVGSAIHERDVADVVVADLLDPSRWGRIDTIVGPDELSKRQQVEVIAEAIGKKITIDVVTPAEAQAFYKEQGGFAGDNADFLFGFESYDGVEGEYDEPHDPAINEEGSAFVTIDKVIGKRARTFTEWAQDHAADFIKA